jgi:ribosome biogenesis protein BRX1
LRLSSRTSKRVRPLCPLTTPVPPLVSRLTRKLAPFSSADAKLDSKSALHLINELSDLHSCNNTLYFEARRHEDLYLWASKSPNGPSAKFHVQNIHTMDELKMTGNCLKGSRGLVSFCGGWEGEQWLLMKEMLTHVSLLLSTQPLISSLGDSRSSPLAVLLLHKDLALTPPAFVSYRNHEQMFSVPKTSRRTKPFIDHILTFSLLDDKIWFRNFQIVEKDPMTPNGPPVTTLVEIGPRFVLTPIRVFEGSFSGATVFENAGEYLFSLSFVPSLARAL